MSIAILLKAAEYVERRDREAEHGYASTLPMPEDYSRRRTSKTKSRKPHGNRSSHNELEKNRRAQLRYCLERLKETVPVGADASRHTTLGLLTNAKNFIKEQEERERRQQAAYDKLSREQRHLQRRLERLTNGGYRIGRVHERSLSECSSVVSTTSSSTSSESDDVDILGFDGASNSSSSSSSSSGGSPSDTDDQGSIQSGGSSDGGFTFTTGQLTLNDDDL